ncbi:MAG: ADP-heptose--LPS heptosyltransferase [Ignavibacteriales bacterium CG_4_9_14_3_um_filter_30_11]|nr:MAG: ADP-heptose--LPS heptosyltransferase [Ignavibacteriales bacterium CG_4_9_14_3_um_filter_30_11]
MERHNAFSKSLYWLFEKLLSVKEIKNKDISLPKKFLIVRQHNQLGDLLSGVSLFRAIKETYPNSNITLIVSPFNYPGVIKNKFIDKTYIYNNRKIYNPFYLVKFIKLLRSGYDVTIVPVVVSISFTSNLIARIAKSNIRIGCSSLDGKKNTSYFFFDRRVKLDWRKHPDANVSERSLDIVRPFGINTQNFKSEISFDESDIMTADIFLKANYFTKKNIIIGLHVGAGKIPNRWSLLKFIELIEQLHKFYKAKFYLTCSTADTNVVNFIKNNSKISLAVFMNKKITEVAALIEKSDLFISNDTGIMHVAGTTNTAQISIFGPTNPFNWAPIGENKLFIRKSEIIDDISVKDVYDHCELLLAKNEKVKEIV